MERHRLEEEARRLDELDRNARSAPEPYADTSRAAVIAERRAELIGKLERAGIFALEEASEVGSFWILRGYHDAVIAMRRYFASAARARLVKTPPPANPLDADISLDWFRTPTRYVAEHDSPEEWLALCELNFANNRPQTGPGVRFTRLEGRMHALHYRMENGATPKLWRATLEGVSVGEHPPVVPRDADHSDPPPPFPLERELDDGSYQLLAPLFGTVDRGQYRCVRLLDGEPVIATLASPQTMARVELHKALALSGPGIAPLRGVLQLVEPNHTPLSVLLEDAPAGAPLSTIPFPIPLADAARIGIAIARALEGAHANKQVVRGMRPELIYVDANHVFTGLVPRCERFWSLAKRPDYGVPPCWDDVYLAPELVAGREPVAASDVFSLCLTLATVTSNEYPYASDSLMTQLSSIATGKRHPWRGPAALAALLDAGLAVDAGNRPSPTQVIEILGRFVDPGVTS